MSDRPLSPAAAAALVFVASGGVLVLEILGIRLLAPYVGLTLETTTAIIGVVLAGIAAGAATGGRLADEIAPLRLLPMLLVFGGGLAVATVPLVRLLGTGLRGGGDAAALIVTLVALFPAAAVLSAVGPAVAKLQVRDLGRTGAVVGRLSAWATAGGLVGTFGTGFVLVPLLATDVAVFLLGGALAALGVGLAVRDRLLPRGAAVAVAVAATGVAGATLAIGSPCEVESTYHCARVEVDRERGGGRVLVLDDLRHSYVDLDEPRHLDFDYVRWIGDAIDAARPAGERLDGVYLGGGGFTLPRYVAATRPGSRARVLEVDGPLVALARDELGLRTGPALAVRVGDARVTLRDEPRRSADLVVGDAFGGRSVPWHLATREFVADVDRVLRPGGLYALNVIDHEPLALVRSQAATLLERFERVALVRGPRAGNLVLLASDGPLPSVTSRGARTLGRAEVVRFAGDAAPLRDDDAPADQLLTPVAG